MIDRVGKEVMEREGTIVPDLGGTMIELPRAALLAGEIAEAAEFFSFGTNDLTQTVFGLSRDDAASRPDFPRLQPDGPQSGGGRDLRERMSSLADVRD